MVRETALEIWSSAIDEVPIGGNPTEKLAALLPFAILAPSSHNSQPWLFRIKQDELELLADRRRRLPVVDPANRELIISCGAALGSIETALHNFGYQGDIDLLPDSAHPELLARIRLGEPRDPAPLDHAMFQALHTRRTYRLPFLSRVLEPELMAEMETIAEGYGVYFSIVQQDSQRMALAELIGEGDRQQMADPAFRQELAAWLHPSRTKSRDGMPGWAQGLGTAQSLVLPLVVRTFDTGQGRAAHDHELALGSPLLAVMGSYSDQATDWLQTGRALMHLLLRAEVEGVAASYLNQPVEVPQLRQQLGALIGITGFPQLILRMGYRLGEERHTPRRDVADAVERAV